MLKLARIDGLTKCKIYVSLNMDLQISMKILNKVLSSSTPDSLGFTLVELLVVIGVLGLLAAGLLATIDPLEQLRKGADTNRRSTAQELVNALTRYYGNHSAMPWEAGGAGCNGGNPPTASIVSNVAAASAFGDCLTALINDGELKSTFGIQYSILKWLYITETSPSPNIQVAVCYDPESKAESRKSDTKFSQNPTGPACDPTTSTSCYWCAQ